MTESILAVVGFGLLFAVFGVMQRTEPGCGGNCGACTRVCESGKEQDG